MPPAEPPPGVPAHRQIVLSRETTTASDGSTTIETVVFDLDYASGNWRKVRRRPQLPASVGAP